MIYSEGEIINNLWENTSVRLISAGVGATCTVSGSFNTQTYNKFKNSNKVIFTVSATVSANNAAFEATLDGTNWFRLGAASGVGVISGVTSNPYIDYRGFVDTWSSGTVNFDVIQSK